MAWEVVRRALGAAIKLMAIVTRAMWLVAMEAEAAGQRVKTEVVTVATAAAMVMAQSALQATKAVKAAGYTAAPPVAMRAAEPMAMRAAKAMVIVVVELRV